MLHNLRSRLDAFSGSQVFLAAFAPLFAIYLSTATMNLPYGIDGFTNALTAWSLAAHHSVYLDEYPQIADHPSFGNVAWFVSSPEGHVVSQYPPGAALVAAPFYAIDTSVEPVTLRGDNLPNAPGVEIFVPRLWPASLAASVATASALGLLALVFLKFVRPSLALTATYAAGLATGAWAVASDQLWQHGPAMLWIALALYLTSAERRVLAGAAFGLAILTRPHTALIAGTVGLWVALAKRTARPAIEIGAGSAVGLSALIAYNAAVFSAPSLSGGYPDIFLGRALSSDVGWYLGNIGRALFDPAHGLLIWAPFLLVLLPGLRSAWAHAPDWVRGATVGGLLYLLLQLKANRFSGGGAHFGYRYPLESLTAAAPLLALSWRQWTSRTVPRTRLLRGAVILAAVGQAVGAVVP